MDSLPPFVLTAVAPLALFALISCDHVQVTPHQRAIPGITAETPVRSIANPTPHAMMIGEVTDRTALFQFEVIDGNATAPEPFDMGYVPPLVAAQGTVVLTESEPANVRSFPFSVDPTAPDVTGTTGVIRLLLDDLEPATRYQIEIRMAQTELEPEVEPDAQPDRDSPSVGSASTVTFTTLPGADRAAPLTLAVTTCLPYDLFFLPERPGPPMDDRRLGFPTADAIRALNDGAGPALVVFNGDVVYYDKAPRARTMAEMRTKWRQIYGLPRMQALLRAIPAFFTKDDHDFRYDDADRTGDWRPTSDEGIAVFRQHAPVLPAGDAETPTYRTVRASRDLQLWFTEGRDYRSPNAMPDGPDKTLWGIDQLAWLQQTLLDSDATYKLIITPTPLVGPDDARKTDNHTNLGGFRHEGQIFLAWLAESGLTDSVTIITGDRHWHYHAVSPHGVHEFSSGSFADANSRLGRRAGDPASTDPQATIEQRYLTDEATGGFAEVSVEYGDDDSSEPALVIRLRDEHGAVKYEYRRGTGAP